MPCICNSSFQDPNCSINHARNIALLREAFPHTEEVIDMETPRGWRQIRAEELIRKAQAQSITQRKLYAFVLGAALEQPLPTDREVREAIVAVSASSGG